MLNAQKYAAIKEAGVMASQAIRLLLKVFPTFQRPEDPTIHPRRFRIPAENTLEIIKLADSLDASGPGTRRKYAYNLWARIAEIYPEVISGVWRVTSPTSLTVEVVEVVGEE